MKKTGPYIGVTGFMSRNEVDAAVRVIPEESIHRLMVGVLMDSITLAGNENTQPGRYPKRENVAGIFTEHPRVLNLVHYSTSPTGGLFDQLVAVMAYTGQHLDGFQLNITWPSVKEVAKFRKTYPDMFLVLQVGKKAMEVAGSSENCATMVGKYAPHVDAVLIDASGGSGTPFQAEQATDYLSMLAASYPDLQLIIAGGLGSETLDSLGPLIPKFPRLSIDAEGRLRIIRKFQDDLSITEMSIYLDDAFQIMAGKELPGLYLRAACAPYGFPEHVRRYGLGDNALRTPRLTQPRALRPGDRLATGDKVLSRPREGGNGSVLIHLSGGTTGHWIGVPGRIPIALLTEEDGAPPELWAD